MNGFAVRQFFSGQLVAQILQYKYMLTKWNPAFWRQLEMAICALSKKGKYLVGITITKTMEGKTNKRTVCASPPPP